MTPLLILRPQPGADATARRAGALGLIPIVAPLFEINPIGWTPPAPTGFDAVLLTSAQPARLWPERLSAYSHLPLFAVGAATAEAARDAGFTTIVAGESNGEVVLAKAAASGKRRLLHPTGREHITMEHSGLMVDRVIVYGADAVASLPATAREVVASGAVALLHSPRAAALFGDLVDGAGLPRHNVTIVGISEAVRAAAGQGWADTLAAPSPGDEAMLAIAARLCDQAATAGGGEDRE